MKSTLLIALLFAGASFGQTGDGLCKDNCDRYAGENCLQCHNAEGPVDKSGSTFCWSCPQCATFQSTSVKLDVVSIVSGIVPRVKPMQLGNSRLSVLTHAELMRAAMRKGVFHSRDFKLDTSKLIPLELLNSKRLTLFQ